MFHELTESFPTFDEYVAAYGRGSDPVILRTRLEHYFNINGKSGKLPAGTRVIGFKAPYPLWPNTTYRIPCIGFVHDSCIDLED